MAVLAVNARRQHALLLNDIRGPKDLAGLRVQTQCLKRLIVLWTVLRHTGSQVNASFSHDGRRPTLSRNALLPCNILGGAPLDRRWFALTEESLARWSTKLGAVFAAGHGANQKA